MHTSATIPLQRQLDIPFTAGDNIIEGTPGNDVINGLGVGDTIYAGDGNDVVWGNAGPDTLYGGAGNDTLHGDDAIGNMVGADTLHGEDGDDILAGGRGDDLLVGGAGSDSYILHKYAGQDRIELYDGSVDRVETIVFEQVRSFEIRLIRVGNDLVLAYADVDHATLPGFYLDAAHEFNQIVYRDAQQMDTRESTDSFISKHLTHLSEQDDNYTFSNRAEIIAADGGDDFVDAAGGNDVVGGGNGDDRLLGGDGNDTLNGGANDDVLDGGNGNDFLYGNTGNNSYVFRLGAGQDIIGVNGTVAGRIETLLFEDVGAQQLSGINRIANDLVIHYGDTDSVTLQGFYAPNSTNVFSKVVFADGASMDPAALFQAYAVHLTDAVDNSNFTEAGESIYAGGGSDMVNAMGGDDKVYGEAGDDRLFGGAGNDLLSGGDGNDTLNGADGNDVLDGGAGNDTLIGALGDDTFVLRLGSGQDSLTLIDGLANRIDTIRFEDVTSTALSGLSTNGTNLVVEYGNGDKASIVDFFRSAASEFSRIDFADGTSWTPADLFNNYAMRLTSAADTMNFGARSETIFAGQGADVIDAGAGDDKLYGEDGYDKLYGGAGADLLSGGNGNDTLTGGLGDDVLDGGADNDAMHGGNGSDVYVLRIGSGNDTINNSDTSVGHQDVIRFEDVSSTMLSSVLRSGTNLVLKYGSGDMVTVTAQFQSAATAVNLLQFTDQTMTVAQLQAMYGVAKASPAAALDDLAYSTNFDGGQLDDVVLVGSQTLLAA